MRTKRFGSLYSYGVGLVAAGLAGLCCRLLFPWIHLAPTPLFTVAVILTALYAGLRPALLTALLSVGLRHWIFFAHHPGLSATEIVVPNLAFLVVVALVSYLVVKVQDQRQWLTITLNSIGDAVLASDAHGRVTFLNPVAASLTGWPREEALGQPITSVFRIINEQTRQPAGDLVARVLSEKRVVALANHTALVAKDGRELPVEDSAAPMLDPDGHVTGVVLVFRDVTGRRRAQEALREREELYRLLFEGAQDGIVLHELATETTPGHFLQCNGAICDMLGYTPEEMRRLTPLDIQVPEDLSRVTEEREKILRDGRLLFEKTLIGKDGRRVPVEINLRTFSRQGKMMVQSILRDITARKQQEEDLRKLNRTLRALSKSDQAMMRAHDESDYANAVCQIIVQDCGHAMVWVGYAEQDEAKSVRPMAHAGFEQGYLETLKITWADTERGRGPTGTAIRTGKPCLCRNMHTDPKFAPWREEALNRGYASSIVLPLMADGRAFGAITIYSRQPDPFSDDEVKLLTELANDLAYGLATIRLRQAHEQAQAKLAWLASFPESNPSPVLEIEVAGGAVVYLNPAAQRLYPDLEAQATAHPFLAGVPAAIAELTHEPALPVRHEAMVDDACYAQTISSVPGGERVRVYAIDVTELKRAEEASEAARAEAVHEKNRLEAIMEALPVGVAILDAQGGNVRSNAAFEQIWGGWRPATRAVSDYATYKAWWADTGRPVQPDEWASTRAVQQGKSVVGQLMEIERFDGRRAFILNSAAPILDAGGQITGSAVAIQDITPLRQAEAALQRANEELEWRVAERTAELRTAWLYARGLLEASLDPLVTISPEGRITDVNQATEATTGVARARLIGSSFSDYFTQPQNAEVGYQRVLAEGLVRDYPLTIRHVSGRTIDVLYNATVYRNEAGAVQGVFAAARDITERLRMERALEASEARYRSFVITSTQVVWTTDAQGQVVEDMPSWRAFTGQSLEQIQGWGWTAALHPEDRERTKAIWSQTVAARSLYRTEYRLRRHDGEYRWVSVRGVAILEPEGRVREWVGTCTDISERKEAEWRREITNALLELFARKSSSQEYLDSVLQVIQSWTGSQCLGIRVADDQGVIPYAAQVGFDAAFLQLENRLSLQTDHCCCIRAISQMPEPPDRPLLTNAGSYRCDDVAGFLAQSSPEEQAEYRGACARHGFASLALVPIRYRERVLGAIHLADRRPARFPPATVEFLESMAPLIGEAIHRFHAEAELSHYRDHLEELVKLRTTELEAVNVQLRTEITVRRRVEQTLRRTAEELAGSNRDLEQFAYVASHDLQEPLRAVAGYVGLLQRRYVDKLDAKALEYVAGATDGAARMQRLINDLLAFSRVGTRGKTFEPTDLEAAFLQALRNLQASIQEAGAHVVAEPLPTLRVDATQIAQLLQNLIGNAIKFRSDRPPEIRVAAQRQEGHWLFSVKDNGIGIEPQYSERIFQIFQRLHTRRTYPGTGIGLAICKKIVERHGGKLWVESQPGQGATFYFTIPDAEEPRQ